MSKARHAVLLTILQIALWVQVPAQAQLLQLDGQPLPAPEKKDGPQATPCMIWLEPEGPTKGILVCVHGLGLHKGCYKQFAERMASLGWGIYAVDVRGFGDFMTMPHGARKVDFEGCLGDVREALELVHKQHPSMPVFLVGESMGGGIVVQAGARYPQMVNGVISSCPASERHHSLSAAIRVGAGLLTGQHSIDVRPIVVDHSTKKQELKDEWLADHQARFELSPVELIQFQHFMNDNHKAAKLMTSMPVIILQGTKDDLVKQSGQETLLAEIPHRDKRLVFVDQAEHLILEEGQFNEGVIATLTEWLDSHLPSKELGKSAEKASPAKILQLHSEP